MLHELLADEGILIVRPEGPLSSADFSELATEVGPYIESHGKLKGLMICADAFPGWQNIDGALSHFKFVRDHQRKIAKVAVVSDSDVLALLPRLVSHFIRAEVKHFEGSEEDKALAWIGSKGRR